VRKVARLTCYVAPASPPPKQAVADLFSELAGGQEQHPAQQAQSSQQQQPRPAPPAAAGAAAGQSERRPSALARAKFSGPSRHTIEDAF
jgi:hypothetical protein